MITKAQKQEIVKAALDYLEDKQLSQNEFARKIGLSTAYMSDIMNGKVATGPKHTPIKDRYFEAIANAINYKVTEQLWFHIETDNYLAMLDVFNQAREQKIPFAIDGDTGMGKSYAVDMYLKQYPTNTYKVICDNDLTAKSFMNELAYGVGLKPLGAAYNIRKNVIQHLKGKRNALLIIDEAENLKDRAWGSIKRILDDLKGIVGIVFVGANNFEKMMTKKADKFINPFPQVNSRIREGGYRQLFPFEKKDITDVCQQHNITEKEVLFMLQSKCRNMRELSGAITRIKRAQKEAPQYSLVQIAKHELAA